MLHFLFVSLFFISSLFATENYSEAVKQKKMYPLGKNVYEKKCKHLHLEALKSQKELRQRIQKSSCSKLPLKYKEALELYLWEVKLHPKKKKYPPLLVNKKQKCPVCGMFLYKYPRWVSMIAYGDGKRYYFDGMKDLMKFYFEHPTDVELIVTQAYYKQESIHAKDAYFVVGSDVYGPMGHELIPLASEEAAKKFLIEHRGKKIVRFNAITPDMVAQLD
jgi:nitrous oxide reductase accessory protein NosL